MPMLSPQTIQESPELLRLCGGKGCSLIQLSDSGCDVPKFLIFPSNEVASLLKPINDDIERLLTPLTVNAHAEIMQSSAKIAELINSMEMSSDLKQSIENQCQLTFKTDYCVSVRSSALAEDGKQHSFAGQLDSFLSIKPTALIDSIKSCIASLYSARAIKYRLSHNLAVNDEMAVIIQQMVIAEKSGVLFSMNTAGNMNESAIVAAYGVGEGVVSDRADSDMFYVERSSKQVIAAINNKKVRVDADSDATQGTVENTLTHELQDKPVLTDTEITKLVEIGLSLEAKFGAAQDIEFAIDKQEKLFLLQARPITAVSAETLNVLDNSNIIESYPGVTLPLSIDFARQAYRGVFQAAAHAFKLPNSFIDSHEKQFSELLIRVNGRVYYQLHNARHIMEQVLVSQRSQQGWRNFLGLEGLEWPLVTPSFSRRVKSLFRLTQLVLTHKKSMQRLFVFFEKKYTEIQLFVSQLENKGSADIYCFYQTNCDVLFKEWAPTIINDYFAMKMHDLYLGRLNAMDLNEHDNLANDLLCGIKGMESEQPIILLLRMKDIIRQSPYLQDLFKKTPMQVWETLKNHSINHDLDLSALQAKRELTVLWDDYLDKYSDRTLEELKLETPTLKMQPWLLASMIQNQLSNPATLVSFKKRQQSILNKAESVVTQQLKKTTLHRWLFNFLLNKTRQAIKDRENMRINRARVYGSVKSMFLELGKRMHKEQLLEQETDVFYLSLKDLKAYAVSGSTDCKKNQVAIEKQAIEDYRKMEMPDRLIYQGELPDLSYYKTSSEPSKNGQLKGIGVSKGQVEATARVLHAPSMDLKIDGEILVTRMTDPGWVFLMSQAAGIVSEKGSLLSHTAIIGREFGIPTVVGVDQVTQLVNNGNQLSLNGDLGEVTILDSSNRDANSKEDNYDWHH